MSFKRANRTSAQKVNVKEASKNHRYTAETQRASGDAKKKEKRDETEAASMTEQQEGSQSHDKRSVEKHEVDDVTSQDNAYNEGQPGWTKAIDNNRGKSKKGNLALNEVD